MNKIVIYYFAAGFLAAFVILSLLRPSIGRYQLAGNNPTAQIDTTNGTVWIFDDGARKWVEITKTKRAQ